MARMIVSEWKSIGMEINRRWMYHGAEEERAAANQNQRARKETTVTGQCQTL